MKNVKQNLKTIAGLTLAALMMGCNYYHGEAFYKDGACTNNGQFVKAECAAGAKEDGILGEAGFHGTALNSLGEVKLNLIKEGTAPGDPVTVYLDMPHELAAARQVAVSDFLKSSGLKDEQIIIAEGTNPNSKTPSSYNISGVYKTSDNMTFTGQAATDDAGAAGGAATGMAGAAH